MAISARLGRFYRRCLRLRLGALPLGREQSMQRRERAERRHRMRLHAHRAAARCIKHPKRQLPKAYRRRPPKAASRRGDRPTLDYLMNANSASHPGMPRVDDLDLVASFRTVCLLVRTCTTSAVPTRRWATGRPTRPMISKSSRRIWRPEPAGPTLAKPLTCLRDRRQLFSRFRHPTPAQIFDCLVLKALAPIG